MTLQQMARKLRATADAIDDLLGVDRPTPNESPTTRQKLLKNLKGKGKKVHWKTREKQEREAKAKAAA